MCDRKFKFCKNQPRETDYSSSSEEDQDNDVSNKLSTQKKNPKKHYSNKKQHKTPVIASQTNTCCSHSCHCINRSTLPCPSFDPSSMCETAVNFNNQTSTLNLPPSFNLRSDKKSTPIRFGSNPTSILNSHKKQNQSETKIEIHREDESNDSFHSA